MPVFLQYVTERNETTRLAAIASSIRSFRDRLAEHRPEANMSGSLAHVNGDSAAEQSIMSALGALHFRLCGRRPAVSIHRWLFRGWLSVVIPAGQVSDAQLRIWRASGELDELQSARVLSSSQGELRKCSKDELAAFSSSAHWSRRSTWQQYIEGEDAVMLFVSGARNLSNP
jgi:hypothetical protein